MLEVHAAPPAFLVEQYNTERLERFIPPASVMILSVTPCAQFVRLLSDLERYTHPMNVSPPSYLDEHVLVSVKIKEGAHLFLLKALAVWHSRHGSLLDYGFEKGNKRAHEGLGWAVFSPEISSAALDELHLVFDPFFAPQPVLWEYVPAAYSSL